MIDCRSYRVIFGDIHAPEFIYHGFLPRKSMQIISALQARTLLSHGCEGFLATIHDTTSDVPSIHDQPIVSEFPDVFPDELPGIPPVHEVEFNIELIPGVEPILKAPYRMALIELKELKDQLQELLERGFIRPSVSPWGASVLFVKKKDGSMRLCIDYRELNKITIHNRYPLPRIDDLFEQLQGAMHFSKIDLRVAAIAQSWKDFKKLLMEEYYPDDEVEKLESEFWYHKMIGSDIDGQRVNRYIQGLAPEIKAHVTSSQPTTIQGAVSMANRLTTDGIKDGIFKKKENVGKKKRVVNERPRPTCYECGDPNHFKRNCPRINQATIEGGNRPNPVLVIEGNPKPGNNRNRAQGRAFTLGEIVGKFSKSEFWLQDVYFLGHVVNSEGIHVDPNKIKAVKNWKPPKTPTEIRSFLGLARYYRRFMASFSKIAKPLTLLTQKNKKFV
nr:putative reverse transcriptase domain-containing protein [Tanacetum cinerariifolium]